MPVRRHRHHLPAHRHALECSRNAHPPPRWPRLPHRQRHRVMQRLSIGGAPKLLLVIRSLDPGLPMQRYLMYINGEFAESRSGSRFPVLDPSTEEIIAEVPDAREEDIDAAVQSARAAFDSGPWPQTTAQERGRLLFRLADRIRQEAAPLAELESRNSGKPIVEAEFDINDVATCFEYYGGLATKVMGHVNPVPDNALSLSLREPVGVAAQIIPWNYPLLMAAWKLAPALAAGCT